MTGIYKITSPTKKVYIGQSVNIKVRWKNHCNPKKSKDQPKLHNSFLKHGIKKHKFEVIQYCEVEELNELERYYQELYNCIEKGLNCKLTETKTVKAIFSKETRLKISKSLTGKKLSEEHKKSLSKAQTGLKRSKEAIQKSIESRKHIKRTQEFKEGAKKRQTGASNSNARLVLNKQTGIYYFTAKEAAFSLGWSYNRLSHYMNGRFKNNTNLIYI